MDWLDAPLSPPIPLCPIMGAQLKAGFDARQREREERHQRLMARIAGETYEPEPVVILPDPIKAFFDRDERKEVGQ